MLAEGTPFQSRTYIGNSDKIVDANELNDASVYTKETLEQNLDNCVEIAR